MFPPGSTGPESRACAQPVDRRERRARAPRAWSSPQGESAAVRASAARARREHSSDPWPRPPPRAAAVPSRRFRSRRIWVHRRPGEKSPRMRARPLLATPAHSGRWQACGLRDGPRPRSSRLVAHCRCSVCTGSASAQPRGLRATRQPRRRGTPRAGRSRSAPFPSRGRSRAPSARLGRSSNCARRRSPDRTTARA